MRTNRPWRAARASLAMARSAAEGQAAACERLVSDAAEREQEQEAQR